MTIVVANPNMHGASPLWQDCVCRRAPGADHYENDEKSEVIRELHLKIQELKDRIGELEAASLVPSGQAEELIALTEDLEEGQRQLKADQELIAEQMRDLELEVSRERAELARRRNELQRMQQEFRRELEAASREAELRDRLEPFLHQNQSLAEVWCEAGTAPSPSAAGGRPNTDTPLPKNRGLFRRWFGAS
jgi:paraquat-inducible protein B